MTELQELISRPDPVGLGAFSDQNSSRCESTQLVDDRLRTHGTVLAGSADVGVAVAGRRSFFEAAEQGRGSIAIKFRARFSVEASCRLRAADPPPPRSAFWSYVGPRTLEFRSQIGSNKTAL